MQEQLGQSILATDIPSNVRSFYVVPDETPELHIPLQLLPLAFSQLEAVPNEAAPESTGDDPCLGVPSTQKLGNLSLVPAAPDEPEQPQHTAAPPNIDDFVKRYFPLATNIARARMGLGEQREPEDVAQELCIRAAANFAKLDHSRDLRGWVATVVGNIVKDGVRHRKVRAQELSVDSHTGYEFIQPVPGADKAAFVDTLTGLHTDIQAFLREVIQSGSGSAVSKTPADEFLHILTYMKFIGCSIDEYIEQHTQDFGHRYDRPLPRGTVKSRLHAAVEKIKMQEHVIRNHIEHGAELKVDENAAKFQRLAELPPVVADPKEKVIADDSHKIPLDTYRYAHVLLDEASKKRFVDIQSPRDILALRTVAALRETPNVQVKTGYLMHAESLKNYIWNSMPVAERRLFVAAADEESIYGGSEPIRDALVEILNQFGRDEADRPALVLPSGVPGILQCPFGAVGKTVLFEEPRSVYVTQQMLLPRRSAR